jgi:hypothetical protein
MGGGFSWLVLVAAFAAVTGLCGVLMARLYRIGSPGGPGTPPGEPQAEPAGRPAP